MGSDTVKKILNCFSEQILPASEHTGLLHWTYTVHRITNTIFYVNRTVLLLLIFVLFWERNIFFSFKSTCNIAPLIHEPAVGKNLNNLYVGEINNKQTSKVNSFKINKCVVFYACFDPYTTVYDVNACCLFDATRVSCILIIII